MTLGVPLAGFGGLGTAHVTCCVTTRPFDRPTTTVVKWRRLAMTNVLQIFHITSGAYLFSLIILH
jgi:hypothetical protein